MRRQVLRQDAIPPQLKELDVISLMLRRMAIGLALGASLATITHAADNTPDEGSTAEDETLVINGCPIWP